MLIDREYMHQPKNPIQGSEAYRKFRKLERELMNIQYAPKVNAEEEKLFESVCTMLVLIEKGYGNKFDRIDEVTLINTMEYFKDRINGKYIQVFNSYLIDRRKQESELKSQHEEEATKQTEQLIDKILTYTLEELSDLEINEIMDLLNDAENLTKEQIQFYNDYIMYRWAEADRAYDAWKNSEYFYPKKK